MISSSLMLLIIQCMVFVGQNDILIVHDSYSCVGDESTHINCERTSYQPRV